MADLDYLVIAPHPDDAELGMGGTILLLKSQGASVGVLDLTDGEPTPHGSPEIRRRETEAATALLGLDCAATWAYPIASWSTTWKPAAGWRPSCANFALKFSSLRTGKTPIPITSPPAPWWMPPASGPS